MKGHEDIKSARVNSTAKALKILDCFTVDRLEVTLSQFSKLLGMPKSTLLNQLRTLEDAGMLMKVRDGQAYQLGYKIMNLSYYARLTTSVSQYAIPIMEDLGVYTGQNIYLTTHLNGRVFYLECIYPSKRLISYSISGKLLPMHCTSCGKAMLSLMPEEMVNGIIEKYGLPSITPNTITDKATLLNALAQYRKLGYAVDNGEETIGVRCVGVAFRTLTGEVAGALSISGSVLSMRDDVIENYAERLLKACNTLSPYAHLFPAIQNLKGRNI